jgi:hypothetical protein
MILQIASLDSKSRTAQLVLDENALGLLSNALNEVCNGVDIEDFEFSTRLGVERPQAQQLLAEVRAVLMAVHSQQ